jgi:hypothetical protein
LLHNQISAGFSEVIYTPTSLRKQTDPSWIPESRTT